MKRIATVLILVLVPAMLFAQGPGFGRGPGGGPGPGAGTPPAPRLEALTSYLGLGEAQVAEITRILADLRTTAQPISEQIGAAMKSLRDLFKAGNADATEVARLKAQIASLRQQLDAARAAAAGRIERILTSDQGTKLAALKEAAKLMGAVREATMLGLIDAPEGRGPGMGPGPGMGRGMMGRRPPL